ncbi:prepilin-type N-terminal cleavage/methylation domain-containing protein [Oscillibacter valericigenes]|uniref:prepilin-type N-terminal cleavage/methylation domain-containing protein n=1 Tax=Oscillibacter valericigenes TaxID=351091 RepID=UPI001F4920F4|nr:prepilin-type N-terminal cleavage/methylation domain-containing protein [Oscillibacter valericigenes]MCF2615664.1 prepilin-type N-terminal cleavage/methylation domain-containing protein [Oscillibacter valericigenes]
MSKFKSQKGFTLAELLVVVAIIAVLVAVAIPVFSASQKKAKLAADDAMIREAYALMQYAKITEEITIDGTTKTLSDCIREGSFSGFLYFTNGATLSASADNAYKLQETDTTCKQLPVIPDYWCHNTGHQKDSYIMICIYGDSNSPSVDMIGVSF